MLISLRVTDAVLIYCFCFPSIGKASRTQAQLGVDNTANMPKHCVEMYT